MLLGAGFDAAVARSVEPIENSPKEMLSLPFQQTARFVSEYESEITDEERTVIDRVLIYDQLADRYRPFVRSGESRLSKGIHGGGAHSLFKSMGRIGAAPSRLLPVGDAHSKCAAV